MSADSVNVTWDDVLSFVKEHNIQPEELDDLVHDAMESKASDINNEGVEAQLSCLQEYFIDPKNLKTILEEQLEIEKRKQKWVSA